MDEEEEEGREEIKEKWRRETGRERGGWRMERGGETEVDREEGRGMGGGGNRERGGRREERGEGWG